MARQLALPGLCLGRLESFVGLSQHAPNGLADRLVTQGEVGDEASIVFSHSERYPLVPYNCHVRHICRRQTRVKWSFWWVVLDPGPRARATDVLVDGIC